MLKVRLMVKMRMKMVKMGGDDGMVGKMAEDGDVEARCWGAYKARHM